MELKSYPRIYFELIFVGFTLFMGMRLPAAFLPIFADELDPTGVLVGFVVSAWFFSRIFIELPSGVLADRLGKRRLLIGGLALSAVGAFMCSMANSIYLLILGRTIWGLGTALFFMSNMALILDLFKSSMRGRALGTFQGIEFIGSFIGAPIGGFILGFIGYRGVFSLAFLLMICSLSVASISKDLRKVDTRRREGSQVSVKEAVLSLGTWGLAAICISNFLRMLIMMGIMSTVFPLYLNYQLGISIEYIGIIMSLRTVGYILSTVTSGYLSDMFGRKPMIISGTLLQIGCLYAYALFPSFELLLLISLFDGFGGGMSFTSLIVLLSEIVPAEIRGGAIGMYRTFMDIGGLVGPPFFMLIFTGMGSYVTFLTAIAILALNIALIATIKAEKPQSKPSKVSNQA
ncbi:MAG: MFS transporter [Candidatus Bathyarchaeota archaeon]|nr:MFS transporter [Candidatus Bathyarchaeota archaeon]